MLDLRNMEQGGDTGSWRGWAKRGRERDTRKGEKDAKEGWHVWEEETGLREREK